MRCRAFREPANKMSVVQMGWIVPDAGYKGYKISGEATKSPKH